MLYDLHIHSCLSPCAEDDMTPATVAGFAKLAGADIIALADHNSARNLPAAAQACEAYGLRLLPAVEVNTAEEIHLLCYFGTVSAALQMGEAVYRELPEMPYDPTVWGRQLICDAEDEVTGTVDKLLTAACGLDIYRAKALCEELGGVAVPAHADKDSYSLLSVLGFCPDDLHFEVIELAHPEAYAQYVQRGLLPGGCAVLHSSDAHCRENIACALRELPPATALEKLLRQL